MDKLEVNVAKPVGELILLDVLTRNGFSPEQRRHLTPNQKDEIRKIVEDLKNQTESFLRNHTTTTQTNSGPEVDRLDQPSPSSESENSQSRPSVRKRLGLKKHRK